MCCHQYSRFPVNEWFLLNSQTYIVECEPTRLRCQELVWNMWMPCITLSHIGLFAGVEVNLCTMFLVQSACQSPRVVFLGNPRRHLWQVWFISRWFCQEPEEKLVRIEKQNSLGEISTQWVKCCYMIFACLPWFSYLLEFLVNAQYNIAKCLQTSELQVLVVAMPIWT